MSYGNAASCCTYCWKLIFVEYFSVLISIIVLVLIINGLIFQNHIRVNSMIEKLAQFTDIRCCLIVGGLSAKVWYNCVALVVSFQNDHFKTIFSISCLFHCYLDIHFIWKFKLLHSRLINLKITISKIVRSPFLKTTISKWPSQNGEFFFRWLV